jgi:hypothetical protein
MFVGSEVFLCAGVEQSMRRLGMLLVCATALAWTQQVTPPKTHLKVGDQAPDFTVAARMNTTGKKIKLSDFKGKKNVVLAFFPAAFTGG